MSRFDDGDFPKGLTPKADILSRDFRRVVGDVIDFGYDVSGTYNSVGHIEASNLDDRTVVIYITLTEEICSKRDTTKPKRMKRS